MLSLSVDSNSNGLLIIDTVDSLLDCIFHWTRSNKGPPMFVVGILRWSYLLSPSACVPALRVASSFHQQLKKGGMTKAKQNMQENT